jgi:hypothetical protein
LPLRGFWEGEESLGYQSSLLSIEPHLHLEDRVKGVIHPFRQVYLDEKGGCKR